MTLFPFETIKSHSPERSLIHKTAIEEMLDSKR